MKNKKYVIDANYQTLELWYIYSTSFFLMKP